MSRVCWFIMFSVSPRHQTHVMKTCPGLTRAVDRRATVFPALICRIHLDCVTNDEKASNPAHLHHDSLGKIRPLKGTKAWSKLLSTDSPVVDSEEDCKYIGYSQVFPQMQCSSHSGNYLEIKKDIILELYTLISKIKGV